MELQNNCLAELSGVSKSFGKTKALNGLDLQVREDELFALLGPNGAGKTTAISLMLGLQEPDSGSARLFGKSPRFTETRRQIGVMMQEVFFAAELRVREQIELIASYYPSPLTTDAVMELTRTTSLADLPYGKLSGGQKRQAQFAMAICGRPRLLFLDEPTAGLDVQARKMMWATLRELVKQGCSIVLTTHYLEEAEALADRVAVLKQGRVIASGSVNEMRSLVTRKKISCTTSLTVEEIRLWPEVESVTREREQLQIVTNNSETVVRQLLVSDIHLHELEVRRAGLAEAFAQITQEVAQ
jgi:ABC-2 type transport system ATP-binding protein